MNIAVVGGGGRCKRLMEIIASHRFEEISPKIIAVADPHIMAPGMVQARKMGLAVTTDYNTFFTRSDIDLIIELTDNMDIYNDILQKKAKTVRAISTRTAKLFEEISRVSVKKKNIAKKYEETKALYSGLINDLIQEDVLVIGRDYRIIDINNTLLNKLGQTRQDVIGHYCYEITHHQNTPCNGAHHPCPLVQTLKTGKPSQTTHIHLDKEKKEIHCSISTYPLGDDGEIIGAFEISRDITQDIKMQKGLMQNEKLASIGRLSAGVAHEINNPLTAILTTAMLIQEDLDPSTEMYTDLGTIAGEALRCRKIVSSLLEFARQSKPVKKLQPIAEVINDAILLTQKQAAFKDITVSARLDPELPELYLDKGRIEQALINLILNAIEVLPPGGQVLIETRCAMTADITEVIVKDTGPGIPVENQDKIFDPFFTTKDTGTGLGLAITHGIIEQHGGSIHLDNQTGQGACFIIRLPAGE